MSQYRFSESGSDEEALDLYWVIPGVLAGMPMPMLDPSRHENPSLPAGAHPDDLSRLQRVGIGAIVCLLQSRALSEVYAGAGFAAHFLPIPDGDAPQLHQFLGFLRIAEEQRAAGCPISVHCAAGLGRTGTILAGYLIAHGESPEAAVRRIRQVRRGAIETTDQIRFLAALPAALAAQKGG